MEEIKRKAGQPKKTLAKQQHNMRLHPDVIALIKAQKNQTEFVEKAILAYSKINS